MNSALIGYTGFVGSNLSNQRAFSRLYNSKNFRDMASRSFDEVFCAGVSAVKWIANTEPEKDQASIKELQDILATVNARRFVLISTVDVYPDIQNQDESFDCHSMENHAYGEHRLALEDFCAQQFRKYHIIRLPGLFGTGLKKNVIYDLLNDNCLDMINVSSSYQHYYLANLWSDVQRVISEELPLVNFCTEPVPNRTLIDQFFPGKEIGGNPAPTAHYDLRTKYSRLWNNNSPYAYNLDEVLAQLGQFISSYRAQASVA